MEAIREVINVNKFNLPVEYNKLTNSERRLVRLQYISEQKLKCHYCGAYLLEQPSEDSLSKKISPKYYPESFFKYPIHLHHSHVTGLTIGAVHAHCNAVLWEHHGE